MKKIKVSCLIAFLLFMTEAFSSTKSAASPSQTSVSFQVFYDGLAPYGSWVSYPGYGYAWVPSAETGFRPYISNGNWVFTNAGWAWVSYYDWGWAPFHYGNWMYDPVYGWLWVPGYDWAPAWVVWGSYGDYYGWAPAGPGYSVSVNYYPPIDYWCFAHPRYFGTRDWSNHYYVANQQRISIESNTVINKVENIESVRNVNAYGGRQYNAGPPRQEVERATNTSIRPMAISERDKPGRNDVSDGTLGVYRPRINNDKDAAKPAKVVSMEQYKAKRAAANEKETPIKTENKNNMPVAPEQNKPVKKQQQIQQEKRGSINQMPAKNVPPVSKPEKQIAPRENKQVTPQQQEEKQIAPQPKRSPQPVSREPQNARPVNPPVKATPNVPQPERKEAPPKERNPKERKNNER